MLQTRLVGNAPLKAAIAQMQAAGRLPHSLLLVGEAGLGAGLAARCIAADLLYPTGGAPAQAVVAGQCCQVLVDKSGHAYIETGLVREAIALRPSGAADAIRVGQIREMRREIYNTSLSTAGRVVLIYHAHRMNDSAFNALLKVLEEPPQNVTFLLTAPSLAGLAATIRSRCVSLALAPASLAECAAYCQKQGVPPARARQLAGVFAGSIGTALAVGQNKTRAARLDIAAQLAQAAANADSYTAGLLLAPLEKDRPAVQEVLADLAALAAAGLRGEAESPLAPAQAQRVIAVAGRAQQRLWGSANAKAALALCAAQLGHG